MAAILDFRLEQLKLFFTFKSSQYFLPSFESICLVCSVEGKIDFQDGGHGHLGFLIGIIQLL